MPWYYVFFGGAIVIYLIAFAGLFVMQRSVVFPYQTARLDPLDRNLPEITEEIVTTPDGIDLIVWTYNAGADEPVILYFHGNGGSVGHRWPLLRWMIDKGWSVVAVGQRGGSGSGGTPSEAGHAIDARAVYDGLSKLLGREVEHDRIVLYGESLGSGIAVTLATDRAVGALILETPYASIEDLAQRNYPYFPIKLLGAARDPFRSIDRIAGVRAPVLFIHGTDDRFIPITDAKRLFEAAVEPKFAKWIEGGDHNDLWQFGSADAIEDFMEWLDVRWKKRSE